MYPYTNKHVFNGRRRRWIFRNMAELGYIISTGIFFYPHPGLVLKPGNLETGS